MIVPFFCHCSWKTKQMSDSLVSKPFISSRHLSTTIFVSDITSIRDWTYVWRTDISLCLAGRFCSVGDLDDVTLTTNPKLRKKVLFCTVSGEILTHCSKRWHCAKSTFMRNTGLVIKAISSKLPHDQDMQAQSNVVSALQTQVHSLTETLCETRRDIAHVVKICMVLKPYY